MKRPLTIGLLFVIAVLLYANFRTARALQAEHTLRLAQAASIENALLHCQPSVLLQNSTEPIDAVPVLRYRDSQYGRSCVFLMKDGRYGNLWWSAITEKSGRSHLEWQFQEWGKYKW